MVFRLFSRGCRARVGGPPTRGPQGWFGLSGVLVRKTVIGLSQPAGLTRYHTHEISHCGGRGRGGGSAPLLLLCSPSPSRPSDVPPRGRPRRTPRGGAGGSPKPPARPRNHTPPPRPERKLGEEGGGSGGAAETLLHVNRRTGRLERRFPLIFISRKSAVARPSCGPWRPLRGARIEIRK